MTESKADYSKTLTEKGAVMKKVYVVLLYCNLLSLQIHTAQQLPPVTAEQQTPDTIKKQQTYPEKKRLRKKTVYSRPARTQSLEFEKREEREEESKQHDATKRSLSVGDWNDWDEYRAQLPKRRNSYSDSNSSPSNS